MIDANKHWDDSVNMYAKWSKLKAKASTDSLRQSCDRMMQRHREAFPTMHKVFDQIDTEALGGPLQPL